MYSRVFARYPTRKADPGQDVCEYIDSSSNAVRSAFSRSIEITQRTARLSRSGLIRLSAAVPSERCEFSVCLRPSLSVALSGEHTFGRWVLHCSISLYRTQIASDTKLQPSQSVQVAVDLSPHSFFYRPTFSVWLPLFLMFHSVPGSLRQCRRCNRWDHSPAFTRSNPRCFSAPSPTFYYLDRPFGCLLHVFFHSRSFC